MASVRVGPWGQLPNVKLEDVVYLDLQENWDEFADEIPDWFRQWRGLDDWQLKLDELLNLELCPVLEEFTRRLFDPIVPCGIMHCKVTHRMEPRRTWLVFRQRTRQRRKYSVKTLAKAGSGEFFYLHQPLGRDLDFVTDDLVRRFFQSFGGLRDSCPFFDYDHFVEHPFPMDPLKERTNYRREPQWHNIQWMHVRKQDYLVINEQGQVGYVPIESERPIQLYAETFGDAILKWLNDPLRDWYVMSCE